MAISLDPAAISRCLAAFIERDMLREEVVKLRAEVDALRPPPDAEPDDSNSEPPIGRKC